jgi:hypothetical protein
MTIQDELAKLPEWPKLKGKASSAPHRTWYDYEHLRANAALARLAAAREWIESQPHGVQPNGIDCDKFRTILRGCTCGRDALLKAMEAP